jgi:hypothetical protein
VSDNVNHPKHYAQFSIECIDALEAWRLGPHRWSMVKYIVRAPFKGRPVEDLRKSRWYLDRLIKRLEAGEMVADVDLDGCMIAQKISGGVDVADLGIEDETPLGFARCALYACRDCKHTLGAVFAHCPHCGAEGPAVHR